MTVLFDHDGSVDDFAALTLLAKGEPDLSAVFVTDGDCYADVATLTTRRVLAVCDRAGVPTFQNQTTPARSFPSQWREDSYRIGELPSLRLLSRLSDEVRTGETAMISMLETAAEPVAIVSTSPLRSIATVLERRPDLGSKIARILWMGGAFKERGNVVEPGHDGTAEWNCYADSGAAADVLRSGVPVAVCPLDICHRVPVDRLFVDRLAAARNLPVFDLLSSLYSLVSYRQYYAWDLLTAAFHLWPEIFETRIASIDVIEDGPSMGRTVNRPTSANAVTIATNIDLTAFHARLFATWHS